jgi:hypothetical protein
VEAVERLSLSATLQQTGEPNAKAQT